MEPFHLFNHNINNNNFRMVINLYSCPYKCLNKGFYRNQLNITKAELDFINNMRMLWEQHGSWTRMAVTSLVLGLPDEDLVIKRLLQNPLDFANTLKFFYGNKISLKFSDLLKDHLVLAAQLIKAAKAGNNKLATEAEAKWYKNANDLANFLSYINPYWSKKDWEANAT